MLLGNKNKNLENEEQLVNIHKCRQEEITNQKKTIKSKKKNNNNVTSKDKKPLLLFYFTDFEQVFAG